MGYSTFKSSPKELTTSDDVGPGQIKLEHLDPALFSEIRSLSLHNHTGVGSRKILIKDLDGYFPSTGFYMYSSDSTKKYKITIDSGTGTFTLTEV